MIRLLKCLCVFLTLLVIATFGILIYEWNTKVYHIWPKGEVYYSYTPNFTSDEKLVIEYSMSLWVDKTKANIKFIYSPDRKKKVCFIIKKSGDFGTSKASIGYRRKLNYLYLDPSSTTDIPVITHELGHVLGLVHEHQRPDRDEYVTILFNNVVKGYTDQFNKDFAVEFLYDYKMFPYDYNSIMHYSSNLFSRKPGLHTIVPKKHSLVYLNSISAIDCKKIRYLYGVKK